MAKTAETTYCSCRAISVSSIHLGQPTAFAVNPAPGDPILSCGFQRHWVHVTKTHTHIYKSFKNKIFSKILVYHFVSDVWILCLQFVCATCPRGARGNQKRVPDHLELDLETEPSWLHKARESNPHHLKCSQCSLWLS